VAADGDTVAAVGVGAGAVLWGPRGEIWIQCMII
jgi:hypothetical protein